MRVVLALLGRRLLVVEDRIESSALEGHLTDDVERWRAQRSGLGFGSASGPQRSSSARPGVVVVFGERHRLGPWSVLTHVGGQSKERRMRECSPSDEVLGSFRRLCTRMKVGAQGRGDRRLCQVAAAVVAPLLVIALSVVAADGATAKTRAHHHGGRRAVPRVRHVLAAFAEDDYVTAATISRSPDTDGHMGTGRDGGSSRTAL